MASKTSPLIAAGMAVLCVGAGIWAIPRAVDARQLAAGATSTYSAPTAQAPASLSPQGTTDSQELTTALDQLMNGFTGGTVSASVINPTNGETLYEHNADRASTPASNLKILTDYTVLRTFDSSDRFSTDAVYDGTNLTLVAGGDTLLSTGKSDSTAVVGHAGLETLAQQTLDSLKQQDAHGAITVDRDTSIFTGPSANPAWDPADKASGFVGDVYPMALYSHSVPQDGQPTEHRYDNAAAATQQAFVDSLNKLSDGTLTFKMGNENQAADDAQKLASIESATATEQSASMMQRSDNFLAETLARNAAIKAGKQGTIEDAIAHVKQSLQDGGISTDKLTMVDLCGLSPDNKVTNQTLTSIIKTMVTGDPTFSQGLPGLPVAGGTGTLAQRFDDANEAGGQGYVHAKTGTLNNVISLTGYAITPQDEVLVFSIIANDVKDTNAAKNLLDSSATTIAGRA